MADVDRYLWSVYERTEVKRDSTGNFTWKDALAAFRMNMALETYVIGGMDQDFRELLYHAGHAMDEAGLHWTILSGFRDDYRQSLATGYKARTDNSLHGGSVATGGYGHGCAADIVSADGPPDALWKWLDVNSAKTGLQRLLPRVDPAHVQPRAAWHELAQTFRSDRIAGRKSPDETAMMLMAPPVAPVAGEGAPALSYADAMCAFLRHREPDPTVAGLPKLVPVSFKQAARTRIATKSLSVRRREWSRSGVRVASLQPSHEAKAGEVRNAHGTKAASRPIKAGARPAAAPRPSEARHAVHTTSRARAT